MPISLIVIRPHGVYSGSLPSRAGSPLQRQAARTCRTDLKDDVWRMRAFSCVEPAPGPRLLLFHLPDTLPVGITCRPLPSWTP